jgi:magnesium-transporting ATPase (P-type)
MALYLLLVLFTKYVLNENTNNTKYDIRIDDKTDINVAKIFIKFIFILSSLFFAIAFISYWIYIYYDIKIKNDDDDDVNIVKLRDDWYIVFIVFICLTTIPFFLIMTPIIYIDLKTEKTTKTEIVEKSLTASI